MPIRAAPLHQAASRAARGATDTTGGVVVVASAVGRKPRCLRVWLRQLRHERRS